VGIFYRLFGKMHVFYQHGHVPKRLASEGGHCSPQRVIVVRNGPDMHHVCPVPPDPALKLGRRSLLAFVGVMGTQGGIESAIYALHHCVYERGRQDVSSVPVGDGDCMPSLGARVHALHLASVVHFAGRVDPEDIPLRGELNRSLR
jgi:hypothetical protein